MTGSPFTLLPAGVQLPPNLPQDQLSATSVIWDAVRGYLNNGMPGDLGTISSLGPLISTIIA